MRAFLRPSVVLLVVGLLAVIGLTAAGASVGGARVSPIATPKPTATPLWRDLQVQEAGGSAVTESFGIDFDLPLFAKSGDRKLQTQLARMSDVANVYGQLGVEIIAQSMAVDLQEDAVRVIAQSMPGRAEDVVGAAAKLGILVEGTYQDMVQLLVPIALLESLATKEEIVFIRLPWEIEPLGSITGEGEPISPALNCRMRAASMLLRSPVPLAWAASGQGSEPSDPATNCRIHAASIAFCAPVVSARLAPHSTTNTSAWIGPRTTETSPWSETSIRTPSALVVE